MCVCVLCVCVMCVRVWCVWCVWCVCVCVVCVWVVCVCVVCVCASVCLSACMQKLGFQWTHFCDILCAGLFLKWAENIEFLLKIERKTLGTLYEGPFVVIYGYIVPKIKKISGFFLFDFCRTAHRNIGSRSIANFSSR